jgi:hypothetical protein
VLSSRKLTLWLATVTVMMALYASPALAQSSGGSALATAGSTAAATISAASSVPPSASATASATASALAGTGGPSWVRALASAAALALVVSGVAALALTLRRGGAS